MENKSRLFIYLILPLFVFQSAHSYEGDSIEMKYPYNGYDNVVHEVWYPNGMTTRTTATRSKSYYNGVVNLPSILNEAQPASLVNNYDYNIMDNSYSPIERGREVFNKLLNMPDDSKYSDPNAEEKESIKKVNIEEKRSHPSGAEVSSAQTYNNETANRVDRISQASQKGWNYTANSNSGHTLSEEDISKYANKHSDTASAVERISKAHKNGWDYTKNSFSQVQEFSEKSNTASNVEALNKASQNGWRYTENSLNQDEIAKFSEKSSGKTVNFQAESLRSSDLTKEQKIHLSERSKEAQKIKSELSQNENTKTSNSQLDTSKKRVSCLIKNVVSPSVYYVPSRSDFHSFDSFKRAVKMQGTGDLGDGKVYRYNGKVERLPQGCQTAVGARGNCLIPFISIAADNSIYSLGDIIYIPELKGKVIRLPSGEQFEHPGYFVVDDVGVAIRGANRFDFFTGNMSPNDKDNAFGYASSNQLDKLLMTDKSKCLYNFSEIGKSKLRDTITDQIESMRLNNGYLQAKTLPDDLIQEHGGIK